MNSQTVDYGIDLGTTNSVIAKSTKNGIKVIKNRMHSEVTSSAVAMTSQGQLLVGHDALDKYDLKPATQFKRLMGTTHSISLYDGSQMSPEKLSSEILKELKAAVQLRYEEILNHVVITVPAMFQQPQCEATHRAAELAGLNAVSLLQEPIAAATAYINDDPEEGNYLIYDLGGGTFDVSIVRLKDGEMSVIAHGGDNYLGGSDFDNVVYNWLVDQIEKKAGKLPSLNLPSTRYVLLRACETAKKNLSTQNTSIIDLGDLSLPVPYVPITEKILEDLIEGYVDRTIMLAKERLDQAHLVPEDINRILMVGGQTMTPYIRKRLRDDFGIPLCFEQDPLTVVATGAAIHASSILRTDRVKSRNKQMSNSASVEFFYDPISPDVVTTISGRVVDPASFKGEIRLLRVSEDWDSGWIPLNNGAFACDVRLYDNKTTEFSIKLRDLQGNMLVVNPDIIVLKCGITAAKPVTPYKYGVVLNNGNIELILDKNEALPAYSKCDKLYAAKTVPAGSSEKLTIYFVEGESLVASDNIQVGQLDIPGTDLNRTLHEGAQIEVRMKMDESRRIKASAFIPLHDLEYKVEFESMIDTPPTADLLASMSELKESLSEIESFVEDEDTNKVIQAHRDIEYIEAELDNINSDEKGAAERISHRLSESKSRVRELQSTYAVQASYQEVIEDIGYAKSIATKYDDNIGLASLEDYKKEADRCLRLEDKEGLDAIDKRVMDIFWKHYIRTDECWIGYVEFLREQRRFASEPIMYDEYLKRAEECLTRQDFEGTRLNGLQARSFLPDSESKENRFYDAGLKNC